MICDEMIRGFFVLCCSCLCGLPVRATVLNDGSAPHAELTVVPHNYELRQKTLRLGGLDADRYANESVVIRLDFDGKPVMSE